MRSASLIAVLVMAIGCGKGGDKAPPPAPPSAVTVLATGSEPRRALRYQIGSAARAKLTAEVDVTIDAGGQGGTLPTMVLGLETRAEAILPDQRARMRMTIARVSARERSGSVITAAALDAEAHHLRGIAFSGVLAPDGTLTQMTVDLGGKKLPPALANQVDTLAKTFQQVAMPLPPTPVGVGAQWQYKKTLDQAGLKLTSTTNVTMSAFDEERVSFLMTTAIAGEDQTITQAGTTIRVTHAGGDGKGTGVLDLTRMTMSGEQTMTFHAEMAGDDQSARMGMTVTTRLAEATAEPPVAPVDPSGTDAGTGSADNGSDDNATIEDH